jgi:hypothetical protein
VKSDPFQIGQQAMMIAREAVSPKNRQSNLSAFLKDNHPDVPTVVYHGTADDITQFQHSHPNKKDAGWLGKGFYFTNNKSLANSYSMLKHGNNENVMPIHLSLKNPFQATMEHKNAIKQKLFSGDQFAPLDFTNELISKGHDGVVLNYGDKEGTKEYVVFNPTQIKSAIGNNGDYDPTHPDITKASGGMVADPKKAARAALYVARKMFAAGGDVTDNPNFQTWFGDSVLHDNGVPRTYYTGTSKDKDFTSFNVGRHGAWFTTDPKEASQYAMENDSQGHVWEGGGYKRTNTASRVIPAHLKASNPYTGDRPEHIRNATNYKKAQSDWFDQLRVAGHDAWVPASMNGNLAVMLKHPTQIKSAIGNNGNFDPKSPHIAKATGGATDDDAFTAYHGTPHEFEPEPDAPYGRFRDTAIGSGEGAQAYGYGHYLAGNEGIAKGYQDRLAKTSDKFIRPSERIKIEGKNLNELMPNASPTVLSLISGSLEAHQGDLKSTHKTLSERGSGLSSIAAKELEPHLNKEVLYQPPYKGHLLETRVRAKPEHFLDWDKPLSEQHPHVQSALTALGLDPHDELHPSRKGETQYHAVAARVGKDPEKASAALQAAGIPGIRYLDASSRGPTGAPTHNYVVFDPKNIDIVKRYAQGGEVYSNHAPRHTMQSPAVAELKHLLTTHRDELRRMKGKTQYAAIDAIMKRISREHGIAPSKLHDDWMSVYHQTPDTWVAGDHGNVVDRALKMTSRGGYAFGGGPAGPASATGAPINFAPAAGAFTGLPSPGSLNLAPSKATMAAILASRPTTHTGSGKPVELSRYTPPSISAPTFNASSYNLPKNEVSEGGQGGSGDRWHPNGGGAPTGGTAEIAAAAAAAAGPLGGGYGDSDADSAARGGRIHRADGGEAYNQLPEPASASMLSKRQMPFSVTPPQGAVPTPMSQATRNLTDPGQVTIKSMSDAFNNAISNHLSLSPGEKITNARQAAQNISEFLGSSKTGKMNALLTANGKLMKAAKSQSGKEPVTIPDGRGVETLGLSLFPDFKEGQFRVCGNSDSCRDSCIGKKSNAYGMDPTQAADQIPLTKQDREGMSGKPRMSALTRTHALMRDPESFAVYLHDLIDHEKIAAARRGNLLGVRLNTLSDIPPSVFAPIIKAHPDVAFYDYTKMNYDPIAPNHHYTYSSTGVSQPEIGVENPFQNWHKSRDRLDQGENVAMAFSHKSGEAFPRMIHDEETGRHYKVVSGDEHDFRPLDIQGEGKAGVIVALKNIAKDLGHETAAQKSSGFFVRHDPGFAKDKKGNFVKDENGDRTPQNLIYTIRAQQKKRSPLTVFRRSGENV